MTIHPDFKAAVHEAQRRAPMWRLALDAGFMSRVQVYGLFLGKRPITALTIERLNLMAQNINYSGPIFIEACSD